MIRERKSISRACGRCGVTVQASTLRKVPLGHSSDVEICNSCFEKVRVHFKEERDVKKPVKRYNGYCRRCGYKFTTQNKNTRCPYCNKVDGIELSEGDYAHKLVKEVSA